MPTEIKEPPACEWCGRVGCASFEGDICPLISAEELGKLHGEKQDAKPPRLDAVIGCMAGDTELAGLMEREGAMEETQYRVCWNREGETPEHGHWNNHGLRDAQSSKRILDRSQRYGRVWIERRVVTYGAPVVVGIEEVQ